MNLDWSATGRQAYDSAAARGLDFDAAPAAPPKVLLADDHDLVRFGLRMLFEAHHAPIEWHEAGNLNDAVRLYAAEPDIALVLLDLNMPDCKGLQGLKQFLEAFPQARVAVISGTQDEFVIGQVRALGAVGYVTKGQAPRAMCDTVMGLLARRARRLPAAAGSRASQLVALRPRGRARARATSRSSSWCCRAAPTRRSAPPPGSRWAPSRTTCRRSCWRSTSSRART